MGSDVICHGSTDEMNRCSISTCEDVVHVQYIPKIAQMDIQ